MEGREGRERGSPAPENREQEAEEKVLSGAGVGGWGVGTSYLKGQGNRAGGGQQTCKEVEANAMKAF